MENVSTKDPWIGRVIDDQFRVERSLGEGGMGSVYLAHQIDMDRTVVIKVIVSNLSHRQDVTARFRREARTLAKLRHPNIVQVYLSGESDDGALYLIMEYVPGNTLGSELKRGTPMAEGRLRHIAEQMAAGLAAAHEAGVVHRDLKPANVMLTHHTGNPDHVVLLDFGIAKLLESTGDQTQITQTGGIMGTPAYMSPEQIEGRPIDGRSDIYSLGVMLYELATGTNPFAGNTPMECFFRHLQKPVTPPRQDYPHLNVSPQMEAVIGRCLEKHPEGRFATATELLHALRSNEIVVSAPPSPVASAPAPMPVSGPMHTHPPPPFTPTPTYQTRPTGVSRFLVISVISAIAVFGLVIGVTLSLLLTRDSDDESTPDGEQHTAESHGETDTDKEPTEADKEPTSAGPEHLVLDSLEVTDGTFVVTDGATVVIGQNTATVAPPTAIGSRPVVSAATQNLDKDPQQSAPSQVVAEAPPVQHQQFPTELSNPTLAHTGAFGVPLPPGAVVEMNMGSIVTYTTPHSFDVLSGLYHSHFTGPDVMSSRSQVNGQPFMSVVATSTTAGFSIVTIEGLSTGGTKITLME